EESRTAMSSTSSFGCSKTLVECGSAQSWWIARRSISLTVMPMRLGSWDVYLELTRDEHTTLLRVRRDGGREGPVSFVERIVPREFKDARARLASMVDALPEAFEVRELVSAAREGFSECEVTLRRVAPTVQPMPSWHGSMIG